jgi:anaerobic selenocysteine-containing dehydrogenase
MITHQNWTRLFVITLIFLGYGAFTSAASQHTGEEKTSLNYIFEASPSVFSDEPEPSEQPMLSGNNPLQKNPDLTHLAFSHVAILATDTFKYNPFKPRAPPTSV